MQAFTSESKSRLLARCKGKTVKYFAQAVKEICEAFEKSGLGGHGGDNAAAPERDTSNGEEGNVNGSRAELRRKPKSGELYVSDPAIDHTSGMGGDFVVENMLERAGTAEELKKSGDCHEMLEKVVATDRDFPTEASVPGSLVFPSIKEETALSQNRVDTVVRHERIESSRASSSSPYSGRSEVKRGTGHNGDGKKNTSLSLGASGHFKFSSSGENKSTNGHRSKDLTAGTKRKIEGVIRHTEVAKSGVFVKDRTPGKLSAGGHVKRLSAGVNKLESSSRGKALQSLVKDQKLLDVNKSSPLAAAAADSKDRGDGEYSGRKDRQVVQEQSQSQSAKKAKHVHIVSDVVKGSIIKSEKSNFEPEIYSEEGEAAVLPVAKRQRRVLGTTSDVNISSEDKRSFGPKTLKSDVPKKRRAVCLYNDDDDDDADPKTPVHGGSLSASKVGSSAIILDIIKKTDDNHKSSGCAGDTLKVLSGDGGSSQKECLTPVKFVGDSSLPATLQLKVDNSAKALISHSPGKEELDKPLVKEARTDLVSPTKSPLVVAPVKKFADQQKPNRPPIKGISLNSYGKSPNLPGKESKPVSGGSNPSQSQVSSQKSRQPLSGERAKSIPKTSTRLNGPTSSFDNQKEHDLVLADERCVSLRLSEFVSIGYDLLF